MKIQSALMAAALASSSGSVGELPTAYSMRINCARHPGQNDIVGLEELSSILGDPKPYKENFRIELADRNTKTNVNVTVSHLGAVSINGRLLNDSDAGRPLVQVSEHAVLIGGIASAVTPVVYEAASTAATLACTNAN